MARLFYPLRLLWASPTTILGLVIGTLGVLTGGRCRHDRGVLEFYGGFSRWFLRSRFVGAQGMALGHVILYADPEWMDLIRNHERGHVRQAELLGPFFLPGYMLASLLAFLQGRHFYRDNWFEKDADRRAADMKE